MQDRINRKRLEEVRLVKNYLRSQPDGCMNAMNKQVLHTTMKAGSTDWWLLDGNRGCERNLRGADDWRLGDIIKTLSCKREGIIFYTFFSNNVTRNFPIGRNGHF